MAEFKDRIPVLNDIVAQQETALQDAVPAAKAAGKVVDKQHPKASAEGTLDTLVDSLHQDVIDRVTRTLREVMAREEASMRTAIRAHLEVMLPEIMEQWQRDYEAAKAEASKHVKNTEPRFGRDYPGALEPMVAVPPDLNDRSNPVGSES